jgi:isopenicillin N synthase-like dioxygenase
MSHHRHSTRDERRENSGMSDDLVPVIDARAAIAAKVDAALRRVGFMQIVGHGIAPSVIDDVLAALDSFFALPLEDKCAYVPSAVSINRGYAASGSESLSYSVGKEAPPDLFEAFNVGPHDVDRDDPALAADLEHGLAENIWPRDPATFEHAVSTYFAEARAVAHRLTSVFARALDIDEDFFERVTTHSTDMLRMIHYCRDGDASPEPEGQLRMGAHTDYGICTVLLADPVEGLEIVGPDGAWHGVVPQPGAVLVNLGDLLAEWTNDRWRSTIHRVVPPHAPGPARRRSMAFFHDGNFDALVEVLPTCCDADNPPKYAPVIAGEHLRAKILGPRTLTASAGATTVGDRLG